jgi:TRAP-type C4-dicarboxylate transport system permease small subunit
MYVIGRFLSFLSKQALLLGAICVALMMLHVTADVIGRYVFNSPLPGTIPIVANYYMVILTFIALGVAAEKKAHISVEIFVGMLPPRPRHWTSVFAEVVTVAVVIVLIIGGWSEAVKKTEGGATIEQGTHMMQVWPSYWVVPLGAGLMAMITIYRVITMITHTRNGLSEAQNTVNIMND